MTLFKVRKDFMTLANISSESMTDFTLKIN